MLRNQLSQGVRACATRLSLHFYEGFAYRMNDTLIQMPALWLIPPSLHRLEGRTEGTAHYRITLYLLQEGRKCSQIEKNRAWDAAEAQMTSLLNTLVEEEGVCCMEQIEMTPAEYTLTKQGELSLRMDGILKMRF